MAMEALDKARAIGAKTERERDWIEAIGAYYKDNDTLPLDDRVLAYTKALERMTVKYPEDFEVWVYYALMLQTSGAVNDILIKIGLIHTPIDWLSNPSLAIWSLMIAYRALQTLLFAALWRGRRWAKIRV